MTPRAAACHLATVAVLTFGEYGVEPIRVHLRDGRKRRFREGVLRGREDLRFPIALDHAN